MQERQSSTELLQMVFSGEASLELTRTEVMRIWDIPHLAGVECGFTGFLLAHDLGFHGLLEGPRPRLFRKMERIATDHRYRNLRILREDTVTNRRFALWTYGEVPKLIGNPGGLKTSRDFIVCLAHRLQD